MNINKLGRRNRTPSLNLCAFYAFDLLYLDGFDFSACLLVKRKQLLRTIPPKDNTGRVRFTDHVSGNGERFFQKLEALKLEGMVLKGKDAYMRSCAVATEQHHLIRATGY